MTLEEFVTISKHSEKTVKGWIEKGLVNGAKIDGNGEYVVSDLARPPYTRARAQNATAIRKSIVKGCVNRYSVNSRVFGIPDLEFNSYIEDLLNAGLITIKVVEDVSYYYSTTKADEAGESALKKMILDIVGVVAKESAKGTTEAMIGKAVEML